MKKQQFLQHLKPHYNDAVNYCRALCSGHSMADAEDVLQDSLLNAYQNIGSLKNKKSFKSWLFKIITNNFYNANRNPFWSRFTSLREPHFEENFKIYKQDYFDDYQVLMLSLSKLSDKERTALLLFEIGGFSIKEIKDIQHENSESAIKSRLKRSREKLHKIITDLNSVEGRDSTTNLKLIRGTISGNIINEVSHLIKKLN